jgi:hypothetical protein
MIKLLLSLILQYVEHDHVKIRGSNDDFTIVIYQVTNKLNTEFTRIDIFTKGQHNESLKTSLKAETA